ncbi:hypothetical protein DL765_002744 [Monosporascus sp. GIB2]|nr:hypothetical protein DL765_002744 [Monosporascus sp. GIB2]
MTYISPEQSADYSMLANGDSFGFSALPELLNSRGVSRGSNNSSYTENGSASNSNSSNSGGNNNGTSYGYRKNSSRNSSGRGNNPARLTLGYECTYRDRASHRANQAAVIQQLQERVREAEARLAQQSTKSHEAKQAVGRSTTPPEPQSTPTTTASMSALSRTATSELAKELLSDGVSRDDARPLGCTEFDFGAIDTSSFECTFSQLPTTEMEVDDPLAAWNDDVERPSMDPGSSNGAAPPAISPEDLNSLHQVFFESFSPVMPILARRRFDRDLQVNPGAAAVKSVGFTVALLAISLSEPHRHLEKTCYILARRYIDVCECDVVADSLGSINFLQALLFLTRYELNNRSCARAWLMLGRATRLARMMRLDEMDRLGAPALAEANLPHVQLPATHDLVELEERRRCFWALYILEGLSTIYSGNLGALEDAKEQLLVSLPSPGNLNQEFDPSPMPYVTEAPFVSNSDLISPFCGAVLVVSLARMVLKHASSRPKTAPLEGMQGFWDRHYALVKLLNTYSALLKPLSTMRALYHDALAFNVHLVFSAAELRLYEAAIHEGEAQNLPPLVNAEAAKHIQTSALRTATTIRSMWSRQRQMCDNLSLSGSFVAWPLCMAIKSLNRDIVTADDKSARSNLLQVLHDALDEVEQPGGPWHRSVARRGSTAEG